MHRRMAFPLHQAAEDGDVPQMRALLRGAPRHPSAVDETNDDGATPLYKAAGKGNAAMVRFLLDEANADMHKGTALVRTLGLRCPRYCPVNLCLCVSIVTLSFRPTNNRPKVRGLLQGPLYCSWSRRRAGVGYGTTHAVAVRGLIEGAEREMGPGRIGRVGGLTDHRCLILSPPPPPARRVPRR